MKQRAPMKRGSGFKRPERIRAPRAPATKGRVVYNGPVVVEVVSVPKDVKARPGKRTPTATEAAWMDAIVRYGCIACRMDGHEPRPAAVHHILRGGVRIGHLFTLPLCDPGHHQHGDALSLISRHPWKAQFEARYGTELELLAALRLELMKSAATAA